MYKNMGRIKRTVEEYMVLTLATFIMVIGIYVFKFPNNFSFGGVTGIAIVLSKFLPGHREILLLLSIWCFWCWDFSSLEKDSVSKQHTSVF